MTGNAWQVCTGTLRAAAAAAAGESLRVQCDACDNFGSVIATTSYAQGTAYGPCLRVMPDDEATARESRARAEKGGGDAA